MMVGSDYHKFKGRDLPNCGLLVALDSVPYGATRHIFINIAN